MISGRHIPALLMTALLALGSTPASPQTARRATQSHTGASRSGNTGAALSPADAQRLQAALAAYDRGDLSSARPALVELSSRYPANGEIQTAAGMTLAEQGDLAGAVPLLRRAHQLLPQDAQVSQNLAVALMKTGEPGQAASLLTAAAGRDPRNADVLVMLAQAQLAAGQPGPAAASFSRAAALQPASLGADSNLRHDWAVALLAANRPAEAVTVIQAAPDAASSAPLQELLGEAEEKCRHFEAAVKHLQRAAELEPSEPNLYGYATELLQHWTFPAAVEVLKFSTARYPSSERLKTALGIAYFGNATYEQAIPVFANLLAANPNSTVAADLLGRSCNALAGDPQPGCAALQQFAEAHPNNAPAALYAAIAILHQPADKQDTPAAEALLRGALRVDPKLAEAWYQLAVLQQSRGDWAGSAVSLQSAIAARPEYPEAHYRLARADSHLGKREEAQTEIALQQKYSAADKAAENKRMQEVMTFLTTSR